MPVAALFTVTIATGVAAVTGHWPVAAAALVARALGFFGVLVAASR
jgi:hypothetical protein